MADTHSKIMRQVRLDWSRENRGRLFPNQIGIARQGKAVIKYGLHKGSSDLIGWEVVATDLPGFYVPIFCSVEVKTIASPKLSKQQIDWLNNIIRLGGRAYVARENKEKGYILVQWWIK